MIVSIRWASGGQKWTVPFMVILGTVGRARSGRSVLGLLQPWEGSLPRIVMSGYWGAAVTATKLGGGNCRVTRRTFTSGLSQNRT